MEKPCSICPDTYTASDVMKHARIVNVETSCDRTNNDALHYPDTCFMRYEGDDESLDIPTTVLGEETRQSVLRRRLAISMEEAGISEVDLQPHPPKPSQ